MAYYGRDFDRPMGRDPRFGGYDYGYRTGSYRFAGPYDRGYDRGYKSRWRTDFGDPFGDRSRGAPFRVIRGEFEPRRPMSGRTYDRGDYGAYPERGRYDRGWWW